MHIIFLLQDFKVLFLPGYAASPSTWSAVTASKSRIYGEAELGLELRGLRTFFRLVLVLLVFVVFLRGRLIHDGL